MGAIASPRRVHPRGMERWEPWTTRACPLAVADFSFCLLLGPCGVTGASMPMLKLSVDRPPRACAQPDMCPTPTCQSEHRNLMLQFHHPEHQTIVKDLPSSLLISLRMSSLYVLRQCSSPNMGLRMATYLILASLPKHSNIWSSPSQLPHVRCADSCQHHPAGGNQQESLREQYISIYEWAIFWVSSRAAVPSPVAALIWSPE
jgi:hypothetical protein